MANLITGVPGQTNWIFELTKYDFVEANAHLIASVPGIHSYRSNYTGPIAFKYKCSERFLGSVVAAIVGLSHRFQGAADSNGVQLRKLAAYLAQSSKAGSGMTEVILRREKNIPQDVNAFSVLVSNPKQFCDGGAKFHRSNEDDETRTNCCFLFSHCFTTEVYRTLATGRGIASI
ncbi:hypothetical protein vseg_010791 [Gypsophila vaccaria]